MPFYYIPNINFLFFSSEIVLVSSGVKYFTSDDMAFSYFTSDGFGTTFLKTKKRRGKKLTTRPGSLQSTLFFGNFMHLLNLQFVTYMYKWTTLANYGFRPDIGQIHIRAACLVLGKPSSSEVVQYLASCPPL